MARHDRIELEWRTHPRNASYRYAELVINGRPLREHVERSTKRNCDLIPPLGWTIADYHRDYVERLLLRRPSAQPTGRREILVCPLCGTLGCGCISAAVDLDGGVVRWTDLGLEHDLDKDSLSQFGMGSLPFNYGDMERVLRTHRPVGND